MDSATAQHEGLYALAGAVLHLQQFMARLTAEGFNIFLRGRIIGQHTQLAATLHAGKGLLGTQDG